MTGCCDALQCKSPPTQVDLLPLNFLAFTFCATIYKNDRTDFISYIHYRNAEAPLKQTNNHSHASLTFFFLLKLITKKTQM